MSEFERRAPNGAEPGRDPDTARRKNWGLKSFFETLNSLTMTSLPGEASLLKLADNAIKRTRTLKVFRASGELIQDIEVLVQGNPAMLFQYPARLKDCLVDVVSSGKALVEVVRVVGGRRREVLLSRRLDEVPEQGLVLADVYPNKQRLVLEIQRLTETKYQVKVALETSGEPVIEGRDEVGRRERCAGKVSMTSRVRIAQFVGGIGARTLQRAHSTVAPALIFVVLVACSPVEGDHFHASAPSRAATTAAVSRPDPASVGPGGPSQSDARALSAAFHNGQADPPSLAAAQNVSGLTSANDGAKKRGPSNTKGGNGKTNKATIKETKNDKWGELTTLRLATVKRLAVRVDRGHKEDEELDRSLQEWLTTLLRKSGVEVVDAGAAKDYDAVLTLRYETATAAFQEAAALFAKLDDVTEKTLRQYFEDCSPAPGSNNWNELQNASEKLVETLVADLEDAQKRFETREVISDTPDSGL